MGDVPPIHVINLDQSVDRWHLFKERNAHLDGVIRVSAIDGRALEREKLIRSGHIHENLAYPAGTLGCAMSHVRLWEQAASQGGGVTILEDDVVVSHRFPEHAARVISLLPDDWDIVVWGYDLNPLFVWVDFGVSKVRLEGYGPAKYEGWKEFQANDGPFASVKLLHSFGAFGYSISAKGARAALDRLLPLRDQFVTFPEARVTTKDEGIDIALCALYPAVKAYICFPHLIIHSDGTISNRQTIDGEKS